jgi:hypothetical protein
MTRSSAAAGAGAAGNAPMITNGNSISMLSLRRKAGRKGVAS